MRWKLKGWMDKEEHYDVQIKSWMEKGGHYNDGNERVDAKGRNMMCK